MVWNPVDLTEYFIFLDNGSIRIKGHRLGIEHVLDRFLSGYNADEIAAEFPGLDLEKIYATITFYLANRLEIEAYLEQLRAEDEEAYRVWSENPSPFAQRIRKVREERAGYHTLDEGTLSP